MASHQMRNCLLGSYVHTIQRMYIVIKAIDSGMFLSTTSSSQNFEVIDERDRIIKSQKTNYKFCINHQN